MSYQVFISHSSKNADIASAMKGYLDARGVRCWKAPEDIPYGTDWDVGIFNGLSQCSVMVLIFSKEADDSVHVKKEVHFAEEQKMIVIPFKIDGYMPDKLRWFLAFPQWLDGIADIEAAFGDLYKRLQVTLGTGPKKPDIIDNPWPPNVEPTDKDELLSIISQYQDWATNSDIRSRLQWDKPKLKAVAEQLEKAGRIFYRDGSGGALAIRTDELSALESRLANGADQYPFFVNVGEANSFSNSDISPEHGTWRHWDDFRKYSFFSAGGGQKFAKQMQNIPIGAEVFTYISGFGYVGQARVIGIAVPIDQFTVNGAQISNLPLVAPNALLHLGNHDMCEWLVRVEWVKALDRTNAIKKLGLYVHVATSCRIKDPMSIKYLREQFNKV
jgi:hypothetical protein